jgi:hypothetical protein
MKSNLIHLCGNTMEKYVPVSNGLSKQSKKYEGNNM